MSTSPFVIERSYNASVDKVWKAITDKEQMKQWYFDIKDFKPTIGTEFSFTVEEKGIKYVHLCKVMEVIPNKKLKYSWKYEGQPGNSFVTFELSTEGDKTKLKLTHEGLETFPSTDAFAKENFVKGWTAIIGTNLKKFIEEAKTVKS